MIKYKKLISVIIIVSILFSSNTLLSVADESLELKQKIDTINGKKQSIESEVSSLKGKLGDLILQVNSIEEELIAKGDEVLKAKNQLKTTQEKENQQRKLMKKRIVFMYENNKNSVLVKLLESKSLADMLSDYKYIKEISESDKKVFDDYVKIKNQILKVTKKLEIEQEELEKKEQEYQAKQLALCDAFNSKQEELGNLSSGLAQASEEYARVKNDEESLAAAEKARKEAPTNIVVNNSKKQTVDGNLVVERAYEQLGKPYIWGACGPDSFDCSGLVSYALSGKFERIGVSGTFGSLTRVTKPQPGDLCCAPGHVGIYIGGGQMIHAPHSGDVVRVSAVQVGMWYTRY